MSTLRKRFSSRYEIHPETNCWIWQGGMFRRGYGAIGEKGKLLKAHRVSWELHKGQIPNGLCVLHKCDNPSCVNPDHLFLGTYADNNKDRAVKGRSADRKGEANNHSSLTTEQVIAIRNDPRTQIAIAADYGIKRQAVSKIKRKERWLHI